MDPEEFDVVVIGAGITGLAFARFYLDIHPSCRIMLLEKEDGPGGVWSRARAYPGFWSQTGLGMSEFSDRKMSVPPDARLIYNLPEAKIITDYLENYCDNHVYGETTLRERIRFNCDVESISKVDRTWQIKVMVQSKSLMLQSPKLVVASGLYTKPNMPILPGSESFKGKIIHQMNFGKSKVLEDATVKNVIVMGGAKSSADIAYASVKAGKTVSWVLRESGSGAAAFSSPAGKGWYKNSPEIASTRLTSLFTPSIFSPQNMVTNFCHGTATGRAMMRNIFTTTDQQARDLANFHKREGARKTFAKLESNPDYFWLNGFVGMAQQPDFWQTIAESVDVYRSDVKSMGADKVELKDGSVIPANAILCGTGFERSFAMFQSPTAADLGLPTDFDRESKQVADWAKLEKEADDEIVNRFQGLASPPAFRKSSKTPYRLYNLMAPLMDDSILVLGHVGVLSAFYTAECQAIWATAYLDKKLDLPDLDERIKDTARINAFSKRRYPFLGGDGASINFDMIGYCDRLLQQAGIRSHTNTSWWNYWFGVCNASTLSETTKEYIKLHGGGDDVSKI